MARYRVPIADPLLEQAEYWLPVAGFRLITVDGPWLAHPNVTICTFEDDNAPADLEGRLVQLLFTRLEDGQVAITSRTEIPA
jgi:hypothetical protein